MKPKIVVTNERRNGSHNSWHSVNVAPPGRGYSIERSVSLGGSMQTSRATDEQLPIKKRLRPRLGQIFLFPDLAPSRTSKAKEDVRHINMLRGPYVCFFYINVGQSVLGQLFTAGFYLSFQSSSFFLSLLILAAAGYCPSFYRVFDDESIYFSHNLIESSGINQLFFSAD